jgi:DUF2934 family protein
MKMIGRKTVKAEKVSAPKTAKETGKESEAEATPKVEPAKPEAPKAAVKTDGVKTQPARPPTAATPVKSSAPAVKPEPTEDEIAKRAYELYLDRGAVDGFALDDWMQAETELRGR